MSESPDSRWRLVLGVVGSDPHSVGNRILAQVLEKRGFAVFNLGVMVPVEEFIAAAKEADAHALLISSLSGYGEVYARELRSRCIEAGLRHLLIYMGGSVITGHLDWEEVEEIFSSHGIDRVYPPQTRPETFIPDLDADLSSRFGDPQRAKLIDR